MEIDEFYWDENENDNDYRINCKIIPIEKSNKLQQTKLQAISNKNLTASNVRMSNRTMIPTFMLILNIVTCYSANASLMSLPDGIENILGFVPKSTFQCERDGYFGDIDNDCRIFHLCQKQVNQNGRTEWRHWTYACGNQTMFNQLTLTCAFVDEAIPCRHASQFQYLNEVIHKPKEPFLTDADVTSGISYYSNRVMSDGARTRAFRDSRLMAQLGGEAMFNSFASSNKINNFQPKQFQQIQTLSLTQPQQQQQQHHHQQPPSFLQQLPSHSTFHSNRREASADTEDASSRAENAIDTPDQSSSFQLQTTFNEQLRAQQQVAQPQFTNEFTVIHQHQANSNENLRPALTEPNQLTSESHASNNFGEQNGSRFFNIQPQQLQLRRQPQKQQQQQQRSQQQQPRLQTAPPSTASSFDFSISTNHKLGPAPDSVVVTSNQFRPIRVGPQAPVASQFSLITTTTEKQTSLPTSTPFNMAPTFTRLPTTTISNPQQFLPTTTTTAAPSTTTTVGPTTNQPLSTESQFQTTTQASLVPPTTSTASTTAPITTANQPAATATTTVASLPTTTATTTTTTTAVERQQQPRRRQAEENRSQRSQSNRQHKQRSNQDNLLFDQIHKPFQSTRLSAQRRQEPAVVMRRQANQQALSSQQLVESSTTNQASSLPLRASSQLEETNSFWLRPFDDQFMPRFEPLLTRRRV